MVLSYWLTETNKFVKKLHQLYHNTISKEDGIWRSIISIYSVFWENCGTGAVYLAHHNLLPTISRTGAKSSALEGCLNTFACVQCTPSYTHNELVDGKNVTLLGALSTVVATYPMLSFCQPQFAGLGRSESGFKAWFQMLDW